MAWLGLTPEDFAADDLVEVWPENWSAVAFFDAITPGAWNVGAGGPIGVRPEALREIRLALGISRDQWRTIYPDVTVMENEALKTMNASRK